MNIKQQVTQMDSTVAKGDIVNAVKDYFADNATTSDYGEVEATTTKSQMVQKMESFAGSIKNVNDITHHHSIIDGNLSASEFTFDFDMKDGSQVFWHEIIRRVWDGEGKVTHEEYFNAQ